VFEPPPEVADADVLAEVRRSWDADVDRVAYVPVGFGAHHWTAYAGSDPRLFVTYDATTGRDSFADLAAAYAGAQALRERGLEFVLAPLSRNVGGPLVRLAAGALSCTPWRDGTSDEPLDLPWTTEVLRRLHGTAPPAGIPRWRPKVDPDFAEATARLVREDWGPGPYADEARDAVRRHLDDIARWTMAYHRLGAVARDRTWVAAHGEPHQANQLRTDDGRFLIDWDTLRLAPAEVDLRVLVEAGAIPDQVGADPAMIDLFDLEWRLDEISQYAAWFSAPHRGTRDDEIAFAGLREELARP
jgi:spectinomycin phosphotransferase